MEDLSRLCIHTVTTKPLSLKEAVDAYTARGVTGITVWQDALASFSDTVAGGGTAVGAAGGAAPGELRAGARRARALIRDAGLDTVSLCRGGFFPAADKGGRARALEQNITAVEVAAELGAPLVVIVPGADPALPLAESRNQIAEGMAKTADRAAALGVKLAVEPLHPMYADTRSAINTMEAANDLCDRLDHPAVGVAVDVYHLWWDPHLEEEIRRCGESGRILAFHVCDWRSPTRDLLLDRGLMGEGCIDIKGIRGWVEDAGFAGPIEVEIFSSEYWSGDQMEFLDRIVEAYKEHV
mgnify:CR=1 FL=1